MPSASQRHKLDIRGVDADYNNLLKCSEIQPMVDVGGPNENVGQWQLSGRIKEGEYFQIFFDYDFGSSNVFHQFPAHPDGMEFWTEEEAATEIVTNGTWSASVGETSPGGGILQTDTPAIGWLVMTGWEHRVAPGGDIKGSWNKADDR